VHEAYNTLALNKRESPTSKHQTENNNRTIRCYNSFSLNSFT